MSIPDFQAFFLPLLTVASDGNAHSISEAREIIKREMSISDLDALELLPSGRQSKFDNRVAWAKSYLVQAKILDTPKRGWFAITQRGKDLLQKGYSRIDVKILNQYPEFLEFHSVKQDSATIEEPVIIQTETPEEILQKAYQSIRSDLASELLLKIKSNSPKFFEDLVVDLMIALGYGGSRSDAGRSIGQSGDEGIDGIIKEDRLGLDVIYLQAKRWEGSVGRPEVQKFVGALHGKRAKKGVFITTGKFTADAETYVATIDPKVILIDGRQLAELMIDFNLGVSQKSNFEIKKIDTDYFEEE